MYSARVVRSRSVAQKRFKRETLLFSSTCSHLFSLLGCAFKPWSRVRHFRKGFFEKQIMIWCPFRADISSRYILLIHLNFFVTKAHNHLVHVTLFLLAYVTLTLRSKACVSLHTLTIHVHFTNVLAFVLDISRFPYNYSQRINQHNQSCVCRSHFILSPSYPR